MDVKNYILEPGYFMLDGGAMFGIIPKPLWEKVHPADERNRIDLSLRLWCLKSKEKLVIIDTGIGDYYDESFNEMFNIRGDQSPLEKCLERIGFKPSDVTDVIMTHLHFDHVGGLTKKRDGLLSSVFPDARLHLHRSHYEYSLNPTERDAGSFHIKNFVPIVENYIKNNQVIWHESEEGEFFPGDQDLILKYKCSFGHTPYLMHPYNEKFIYLADLIPTSGHVHVPWVMGYDIEPGVTTKYKRLFLDFVMKKNLRIIFEHDPEKWGSFITKNEKGKYLCSEALKIPKENHAYLIN